MVVVSSLVDYKSGEPLNLGILIYGCWLVGLYTIGNINETTRVALNRVLGTSRVYYHKFIQFCASKHRRMRGIYVHAYVSLAADTKEGPD